MPTLRMLLPLRIRDSCHRTGDAAGMARVAVRRSRVPLCLHLDHASGIDIISEATECGFTSVMYDGSTLPFEENLDLTSRVVETAHAAGVSVEAELGRVGGQESGDETAGEMTGEPGEGTDASIHGHPLTDPLQAREFVVRTGIDALAPAVGTAHGLYRGAPHIAFDLISAIRDLVNVPLVLHGGSDIPEELLRQAIRAGIRKVNVGTDLQVAHARALRRALPREGEAPNMRAAHAAAVDSVCAVARAKIAICSGRGAAAACAKLSCDDAGTCDPGEVLRLTGQVQVAPWRQDFRSSSGKGGGNYEMPWGFPAGWIEPCSTILLR
jgi:ketose-bisphosphate aldolase